MEGYEPQKSSLATAYNEYNVGGVGFRDWHWAWRTAVQHVRCWFHSRKATTKYNEYDVVVFGYSGCTATEYNEYNVDVTATKDDIVTVIYYG